MKSQRYIIFHEEQYESINNYYIMLSEFHNEEVLIEIGKFFKEKYSPDKQCNIHMYGPCLLPVSLLTKYPLTPLEYLEIAPNKLMHCSFEGNSYMPLIDAQYEIYQADIELNKALESIG